MQGATLFSILIIEMKKSTLSFLFLLIVFTSPLVAQHEITIAAGVSPVNGVLWMDEDNFTSLALFQREQGAYSPTVEIGYRFAFYQNKNHTFKALGSVGGTMASLEPWTITTPDNPQGVDEFNPVFFSVTTNLGLGYEWKSTKFSTRSNYFYARAEMFVDILIAQWYSSYTFEEQGSGEEYQFNIANSLPEGIVLPVIAAGRVELGYHFNNVAIGLYSRLNSGHYKSDGFPVGYGLACSFDF